MQVVEEKNRSNYALNTHNNVQENRNNQGMYPPIASAPSSNIFNLVDLDETTTPTQLTPDLERNISFSGEALE